MLANLWATATATEIEDLQALVLRAVAWPLAVGGVIRLRHHHGVLGIDDLATIASTDAPAVSADAAAGGAVWSARLDGYTALTHRSTTVDDLLAAQVALLEGL